MNVTSFEEFKNKSQQIIELPGFDEGDSVFVKVKKVSVLGLASSGKIPNSLMGVVTKLFNANVTSDGKVEGLTDNVVQLTQLMNLIAKNSLVEPTYDQIGEYLTDDQLNCIFDNAMGGIKQVTPTPGK